VFPVQPPPVLEPGKMGPSPPFAWCFNNHRPAPAVRRVPGGGGQRGRGPPKHRAGALGGRAGPPPAPPTLGGGSRGGRRGGRARERPPAGRILIVRARGRAARAPSLRGRTRGRGL